jgi:hypothetical protein
MLGTWTWRGLGFHERYVCSQECGFVCPRSGSSVACRLVQDVRTGQWKWLEKCSLFDDASEPACELECAKQLNLGLRLAGWQPTKPWGYWKLGGVSWRSMPA